MTFIEFYKENISKYRAILFDIDGTLLSHGLPAPGIKELLKLLDKNSVPYLVLTNDAMHSTGEKSQLMAHVGLDIHKDKIISCGDILHQLVEQKNWQGKKFFLLGTLGNPSFAEAAGLEVCQDHHQINECFGIINGEGYYDWHDHMQATLCFFRRNPTAPMVVPNPDSYWPGAKGIFGVGAGGQARFICGILKEMNINIEPIYLGKPHRKIFEYTIEHLKKSHPHLKNIINKEIMMLGDSLQSDIPGANRSGISSGLLLTGITTQAMAEKSNGDHRPDFIFDSIG